MEIRAHITESQRKTINQLNFGGRVQSVTQAENNRVRVSIKNGDFRFSLFVGKRGKVFEEEHSKF